MQPTKALSYDERSTMVRRAFYRMFSMSDEWFDCLDVFDDYLVCTAGGAEYYRVGYTLTDDGVEIQSQEWQQVEREWVVKNVTEPVIAFGSEIKALGGGKFGGYLVVFGDETKTDLVGDFFTSETDFDVDDWDTAKCSVYFNHGLDPVIGRKKLCTGTLKKTEAGVWLEGILNERDEYEKAIYDGLIVPRKAGMSSGTLPHLVERAPVGKAFHIKRWSLGGDGSITHIPAEPRTSVMPLKSLTFVPLENVNSTPPVDPEVTPEAETQGDTAVKGGRDSSTAVSITVTEGDMPENAAERLDSVESAIKQMAETQQKLSENVEKALKFAEDSPALRNAGYYSEDGGEADKNIKTAVDMLLSIKRGDVTRCVKHYGLKAQVEDTGNVGGYYVPETTLTGLMPNITLVSGIGNMVRRIPVPTPAGKSPIRDYSVSVTANTGQTASASGIKSQARAEQGAYQEETMTFELLEWHVRDYASGYVKMSKELTNDAPMVQSMLEEAIREDVANKEEWAILRGDGVGKPLGVLNWAGIIEVEEDTDNTFAVADSDEMVSRLLQSSGGNFGWVHHPGTYTDIAAFQRGTGGISLQTNISGALSTVLHGYPRFNSQHLPAQGTTGYVILGDWSRYFLFELGGLYIEFSRDADFLNGNNVWRFGKRQDGKPAMTSAITLADGSFTVSPFVVLKNKT